MSRERRNLYRILHVQPEAPPEVIKAAWRALMSTLRAHPDLGGDPQVAARLNAAYEVLSDPERRRAYDQSLRRSPKGPTAGPAEPPPRPARPARAVPCPFCGHPQAAVPAADTRCASCDSPLAPAPRSGPIGELTGRRRGPRFARDTVVSVRLPGEAAERIARLRDLSFSGLSLSLDKRLPLGAVMRVQAPAFEALVRVVDCRIQTPGYTVHGELLTLSLDTKARGVYVDTKA